MRMEGTPGQAAMGNNPSLLHGSQKKEGGSVFVCVCVCYYISQTGTMLSPSGCVIVQFNLSKLREVGLRIPFYRGESRV